MPKYRGYGRKKRRGSVGFTKRRRAKSRARRAVKRVVKGVIARRIGRRL